MPRPSSVTEHRAVGLHRDAHRGGEAGHGLVDGVVHDLVHHVVQGVEAGAADVHAGALADGLEALEHLDLIRIPPTPYCDWPFSS
jgi:hypothetical protein